MMDLQLHESGSSAVIQRLNALGPLTEGGAAALEGALRERVRRRSAREDLAQEGDRPDGLRVVLSGWANRYKTLEDGRRQVVNLLLPGDTCDYGFHLLHEMDHSIAALTALSYAELSRESLEQLTSAHPSLAQALWRETLVTASIQREWTVNLGQRIAYERVAHLLCEVFLRLRTVGLTNGTTCAFPLTQADMADATGLSVVHVNRTVQELRAAGLIVLRDKSLTVNDLQALQDAALFNPNYLHLDPPRLAGRR